MLAKTIKSSKAICWEQQLSERQTQILELVAQGLSQREMSEQLAVSVHTVREHLKILYRKLRVNNRLAALSVALAKGMLTYRRQVKHTATCPQCGFHLSPN